MTITFLYKCRRCGGIDRSYKTGAGYARASEMLIESYTYKGVSLFSDRPQSNILHYCGGDACGIADLIGYEPEQT